MRWKIRRPLQQIRTLKRFRFTNNKSNTITKPAASDDHTTNSKKLTVSHHQASNLITKKRRFSSSGGTVVGEQNSRGRQIIRVPNICQRLHQLSTTCLSQRRLILSPSTSPTPQPISHGGNNAFSVASPEPPHWRTYQNNINRADCQKLDRLDQRGGKSRMKIASTPEEVLEIVREILSEHDAFVFGKDHSSRSFLIY